MTQIANNTVIPNEFALSNLVAQGSPSFGNQSASVTIIEFGDFQCHFCGRFAIQTEPSLNSTYFQTGKANLVFKHFVTHGPDSFSAAMASQCANDQGKFWNFYKTLYNNQGEENSGWASANNMKKFAQEFLGWIHKNLIPVSTARNTNHWWKMILTLRFHQVSRALRLS